MGTETFPIIKAETFPTIKTETGISKIQIEISQSETETSKMEIEVPIITIIKIPIIPTETRMSKQCQIKWKTKIEPLEMPYTKIPYLIK